MGRVRVGTSGWSYDDWAGRFYPEGLPRARWAEYYRRVFPTVEINATFYRLPRPSSVERWRDEAPAGFEYVVKGSRYLTHLKRLRDAAPGTRVYLDRIAPLAPVLRVVLWQLPPDLERDLARLGGFLPLLPDSLAGHPLRHAVEFRHPSWLVDATYDLLASHDVATVWISGTRMPAATVRTTDLVYLRLHGLEGGYAHDYTDAELEPWVAAVRAAADDGAEGWVFFNNDGRSRAPANARRFTELLGDAAVPWAAAAPDPAAHRS